MMKIMLKAFMRIAPVLILLAVTAAPALARPAQEEVDPDMDARLASYKEKIDFDRPSIATAWFVLAGLGLVALGPVFLNAHRTHLD